MANDIEFHFEVAAEFDDTDDELTPPRQTPPRVWIAVAVVALLVLVGIGLARQSQGRHSTSEAGSTNAAPSSAPSSTPTPAADPAESLQTELTTLAANPALSLPVLDERHDCPVPPLGTSPQKTLTTTVQEALPDFAFQDAHAITDGATGGLCTLEVRFRGDQGGQLIVLVRSPPGDGTPNVLETLPDPVLTASSFTGPNGWRIDAGVLGVPVSVPDLSVLTVLTASPQLTW